MKKLRVPIPAQRSKELLELAKKMLDKHIADGDASKLNAINWVDMQPKIEMALSLHDVAELLKSQSRQKLQDRNLLIPDIAEALRNGRDILTGTYKKDMKKLGNWGFNVVEAKATKTPVDQSKIVKP